MRASIRVWIWVWIWVWIRAGSGPARSAHQASSAPRLPWVPQVGLLNASQQLLGRAVVDHVFSGLQVRHPHATPRLPRALLLACLLPSRG